MDLSRATRVNRAFYNLGYWEGYMSARLKSLLRFYRR